jgi:hypothetical protein
MPLPERFWKDFTQTLSHAVDLSLRDRGALFSNGMTFEHWFPEKAAFAVCWGVPTQLKHDLIGRSLSLLITQAESTSDSVYLTAWSAAWRDLSRPLPQATLVPLQHSPGSMDNRT